MIKRSGLIALALLWAPAVIGADSKLNLAPSNLGDSGNNSMLNVTNSPNTPHPAPSPVHLTVSCIDDSGIVVPQGDVRYDRCIEQAHGHGRTPIAATGSTQAIGVTIGTN